MAEANPIADWWIKSLLGQTQSAHPVFGDGVKIHVNRDVVELKGVVESTDLAEEMEREARTHAAGRSVINHIRITGDGTPQHMQSVLAIFRTEEQARVAAELLGSMWPAEKRRADVVTNRRDARAL